MRLISLRVRPPSAPTPKTATEQQPVAGNARFVTCHHAPFKPPSPAQGCAIIWSSIASRYLVIYYRIRISQPYLLFSSGILSKVQGLERQGRALTKSQRPDGWNVISAQCET